MDFANLNAKRIGVFTDSTILNDIVGPLTIKAEHPTADSYGWVVVILTCLLDECHGGYETPGLEVSSLNSLYMNSLSLSWRLALL